MNKYYVYRMDILENDKYHGVYFGQHKMSDKEPSCDGYKGSGTRWKKEILRNHVPVKKTVLKFCESVKEANYWEKYYIAQAKENGEYLWNVSAGGDGFDHEKPPTEEEQREKNKLRYSRWYAANKERNLENGRRWRSQNRERSREINRRSVEKRKDYWTDYHRQYYQDNKERLSANNKKYYEEHKEHLNECSREYFKKYRETHAEELAEKGRRYYAENKEKRNAYYNRQCSYDGKTMTFRALILKFLHQGVPHPTQVAKQYLIEKENEL